jgi:putative ABC transport system ATP-binding protein
MISVQRVSKNFKKISVLKDISFEVKEGECIVLSGVSGSGKSTLLSLLATLSYPSSGVLQIDGVDVVKMDDFTLSDFRAHTIGYIPQHFYLFDFLSVEENIMIPLLTQKQKKTLADIVSNIMQKLAIEHKAKEQVSRLSGGEKQRCIIARAIVNNPKILICDEPTSALDQQNTKELANILQDLKNEGKTIIIATHDPFIVNLDLVDRVINIKDGKIE